MLSAGQPVVSIWDFVVYSAWYTTEQIADTAVTHMPANMLEDLYYNCNTVIDIAQSFFYQ